MASGRLEAQITVPTGGWASTLAITGGAGSPYTVTIAAGTYYPTTFLSALSTAMNAAAVGDGTFTVSASTADGTGTGQVTIAHTVETFTFTPPTAMRELLGFAAALTPAALTFTGTSCLAGLWLPDCPQDSAYGADPGHYEIDASRSVTPGGQVYALAYGRRRLLPSVRWSHVTRARARIAGEAVPGQSFESWLLATHGGTRSYFVGAPPVRVYAGAADASPYATLYLTRPDATAMDRPAAPWHGLYSVEIAGYAQ